MRVCVSMQDENKFCGEADEKTTCQRLNSLTAVSHNVSSTESTAFIMPLGDLVSVGRSGLFGHLVYLQKEVSESREYIASV
jgi:hypothetical protein